MIVALIAILVAPLPSRAQQRNLCPRFLTRSDSSADSTSLADRLLNRGYQAGDSEGAAIALLGPPTSRVVDTVSNRYDVKVIDSMVTLHYPGITIAYYKRMADRAELIEGIRLTTPRC